MAKQSEYSNLKVLLALAGPSAGKICVFLSTGSVVDSVLCWDTPIPGAGKKGGVSKDPPVSIAPFQKQLVYSKEGGGLEDVQITLRRTMDPVRPGILVILCVSLPLSLSPAS